jgi:hypothetical protein
MSLPIAIGTGMTTDIGIEDAFGIVTTIMSNHNDCCHVEPANLANHQP